MFLSALSPSKDRLLTLLPAPTLKFLCHNSVARSRLLQCELEGAHRVWSPTPRANWSHIMSKNSKNSTRLCDDSQTLGRRQQSVRRRQSTQLSCEAAKSREEAPAIREVDGADAIPPMACVASPLIPAAIGLNDLHFQVRFRQA